MLNGGDHRFQDVVASALGWWADAGVGALADESAHDWLAPPPRPAAPVLPAPAGDVAPASPADLVPAPAPTLAPLPDTLAALHALLATGAYAPQPAPPGRRVSPSGDPAAGLMIVTDMPDAGDAEAGQLFAGETARLYDAMLAAIGRDRAHVYAAPFSPARLAGRLDSRQAAPLVALMRHHIALVRPAAIMLMGDEAARWMLGAEALTARGGLRTLNHDGGMTPAIALSHPRTLRRFPVGKAAAWADMRSLLGVMTR